MKDGRSFYFYFGAPAILFIALILFYKILPETRQQILVGYLILHYLLLLFWKRILDHPRPVPPPLEKMGQKPPGPLRQLALHEYDYIQETMAQAMDDRHTMVNYFLLATGVVMAAISAIFSDEGMRWSSYKNEIASAICIIFNFIAWIYFMNIIRLRQAWCESAAAMNRIKQFFLFNFGLLEDDARSPFRWHSKNTPPAARTGTLYYLAMALISFISSVALAATSVLSLPAEFLVTRAWVPALFFLYHFLFQGAAYHVLLRNHDAAP